MSTDDFMNKAMEQARELQNRSRKRSAIATSYARR